MTSHIDSRILVIQTGGTIDKDYPKSIKGYAFEICEAAVTRILERARSTYKCETVTACRKDSQDITDKDRQKIAELCKGSSSSKVLITHGTDTLLDTAAYLSGQELNKTIVLTGAFLPETFKNSDADFNVGMTFGALQCLKTTGVYVCMNGIISEWSKCKRNENTNLFQGDLF